MKKKRKNTTTILFIFIAIVFFGYVFLRNTKNITQINSTVQIKTPAFSDGSDLQNWDLSVTGKVVTVSNDISKYSFTIPDGWKTQLTCNGGIKDDKYICIMSPDIVQDSIPNISKGQLITIAPPGSSYFINGLSQDPSNFCQENAMAKYLSCKKLDLNGQKIIKRVFANYSFIDVAILKENDINLMVRLEYSYPVGYNDTAFDEFLSSLKYSQ